jgi:monooxygenase
MTCRWLHMCTGYYDYDEAYLPDFPGRERFKGPSSMRNSGPRTSTIAGKRVVVIGSGATAVTIVPEMAKGGAAHVTMLQRSPTYMVSHCRRSTKSPTRCASCLATRLSYGVMRPQRAAAAGLLPARPRRPELMKKLIRKGLLKELPADYEVETHFNPAYNPWDQRLCLVPDADLFAAIAAGKVEVVTDHIERFVPGHPAEERASCSRPTSSSPRPASSSSCWRHRASASTARRRS